MANTVRDTDNTINVDVLLAETISAYNKFYPVISQFSTDFSAAAAKKNETLLSRVLHTPTVSTFNGNYMTSADNANTLSSDVPITLSEHKYASIKLDYEDAISTKRNLIGELSEQMAHALGADFMAKVWDELTEANFSNQLVRDGSTSGQEHDLTMLNAARETLNGKGASPTGRYGIVSSATFTKLLQDEKIASGDYYGQLQGSNGVGVLRNLAGFEAIYEYPAADANSESLVGFFGDKTAICLAGRVPVDFNQQAALANAPAIASSTVVQDPSTGFSLMGMAYQQVGTFDVYASMTHIYGVHAGSAGGSAGDKTDNGGVLVATA